MISFRDGVGELLAPAPETNEEKERRIAGVKKFLGSTEPKDPVEWGDPTVGDGGGVVPPEGLPVLDQFVDSKLSKPPNVGLMVVDDVFEEKFHVGEFHD